MVWEAVEWRPAMLRSRLLLDSMCAPCACLWDGILRASVLAPRIPNYVGYGKRPRSVRGKRSRSADPATNQSPFTVEDDDRCTHADVPCYLFGYSLSCR